MKQKWQGQQQNQWNNRTNDGVINNSYLDIIVVMQIFSLSFHHLHHVVIVFTTGNECLWHSQVVPKFEFSSHFHIRHIHHQTLSYSETLIIFSSLKIIYQNFKAMGVPIEGLQKLFKIQRLRNQKNKINKKRISLSKEK